MEGADARGIPPKDDFVRGLALTQAKMWMLSAEAQLQRADRVDPLAHETSLSDVHLQAADLELCLVALVRFRRAFVLLQHLHPDVPDSPFLRAIDDIAPELNRVRNVAEHWDEYARGEGRGKPKEQRGRTYRWSPDGVLVVSGSGTVNVTEAVRTARAIVDWISRAMGSPSPPTVVDP